MDHLQYLVYGFQDLAPELHPLLSRPTGRRFDLRTWVLILEIDLSNSRTKHPPRWFPGPYFCPMAMAWVTSQLDHLTAVTWTLPLRLLNRLLLLLRLEERNDRFPLQ